MKDFKQYIRLWMPPVLLNLKNRLLTPSVLWHGDYPDWTSAMTKSGGYDAADILEKAKTAARTVASGKAVFERDSVLL